MYQEDLETRFNRFLAGFEGSVSLDDSFPCAHLFTNKKADFIFDGSKIIVEVKSLQVDPLPKVKAFLEKQSQHPEFPQFFWKASPEDYLEPLPNSTRLKAEMRSKIYRRVQSYVKDADDQINDTKAALNLPDACGVLIILNDKVPYLGPDLIFEGASKILLKQSSGNYRYRNVQLVQIMSETHHVRLSGKMIGSPVVTLIGPTGENSEDVQLFLNQMQQSFSEFMGVPYFQGGDALEYLKELHTNDFSFTKADPVRPSRHEIWRRNYRRYPYLRASTDENLVKHGASLIKKLRTMATPDKREKGKELMVPITHFFEECEFRKMDMKKIRKWMSLP